MVAHAIAHAEPRRLLVEVAESSLAYDAKAHPDRAEVLRPRAFPDLAIRVADLFD